MVSFADNRRRPPTRGPRSCPGRSTHVYNRSFRSFELVAAHAAGAHFMHRLRQPGSRTRRFEADEVRPLSDENRDAGVASDRISLLAGSRHRRASPARYTEVFIAPAEPWDEPLRLLSDLADVPAHMLGLNYRDHWQVEPFFRCLRS